MKYIAAFGRFWWDFIVGDDPILAAGVIVGIAATAAVVSAGVAAWWLLPVVAALVLGLSLRRAIRR